MYSSKMGAPGKTEGTIFSPIPCEIKAEGPEQVGGEAHVLKLNFVQRFKENVMLQSRQNTDWVFSLLVCVFVFVFEICSKLVTKD